MGECLDRRADGWTKRRMEGMVDKCVDEWMDRWMVG